MHNVDIRNVSIGQILYFLKVVEYGNITHAAKHLNLSQPTLSKSLKSLEQQLDLQLFVRTKNSIRLTPAGRYLYSVWTNRISSIEKEVQYAHILQLGEDKSIVVGCMDSVKPESFLLPIVEAFEYLYSNVHVRIESDSAQDIRRMLIRGDLDVIFSILYDFDKKDLDGVAWEKLGVTPHCACMTKDNPLASREYITMDELKRADFICISSQYLPEYLTMVQDLCKPYGFVPNITKYVMSANSLTLNLNSDNEVFICDSYYSDLNRDQHCIVPIHDTESAIVMAWRKDSNKVMMERFLEEARHYFEKEC